MIIDKNFSPLMERCFGGKLFSKEETKALVHGMLDDTLSDIRIASVLTAFRFVNVTKENILAIIESCRENSVTLNQLNFPHLVDCGGTGGDYGPTVNISTMASLVAAASGAYVVKFSGKSLSSKTGSSNVLKLLGVQAAENEDDIKCQLQKTGIVLLNAATFYPTLKNLSEIRKTLGFKTIIDLVFPLANPVSLLGQVVGVYTKDVQPLMIEVLKNLGRQRALVVNAEDGLDEISVCSATNVAKLDNHKITYQVWKPADFGMKTYSVADLRGSNLEKNANIIMQVLNNNAPAAIMNAVELNAAATVWSAQLCNSIPEALAIVRQSIQSGKALKKFESWKSC